MLQTNQIDRLRKVVAISMAKTGNQIMRAVNEAGANPYPEGELLNSPLFSDDVLEFGLQEVSSYGIVAPACLSSDVISMGFPCPDDLDPNHEIGARILFSPDGSGTLTSITSKLCADLSNTAMASYAEANNTANFLAKNSQGSTTVVINRLTSSIRFIWPKLLITLSSQAPTTRAFIEERGVFLRFNFEVIGSALIFRPHAILLDYNVLDTVGSLPAHTQPIRFNGNMI